MTVDRERVRGYVALLNRLGKRAEQMMLQEDPAEVSCEVLVRLFNQYVSEIGDMLDVDSQVFATIQFNPSQLRGNLAEVMFRSEQLSEMLHAMFTAPEQARFELPPFPDVSGLVNAERAEQLASDVEKWARSVGHRAEKLSRELSERIPQLVSRYTDPRQRVSRQSEAKHQLRMRVLQRVQDGELTVDEALQILGRSQPDSVGKNAEDGAAETEEENDCCG